MSSIALRLILIFGTVFSLGSCKNRNQNSDTLAEKRSGFSPDFARVLQPSQEGNGLTLYRLSDIYQEYKERGDDLSTKSIRLRSAKQAKNVFDSVKLFEGSLVTLPTIEIRHAGNLLATAPEKVKSFKLKPLRSAFGLFSSEERDFVFPVTIDLVAPTSEVARADSVGVYYQIFQFENQKQVSGFIPSSKVTWEANGAMTTFSFTTQYFGVFQLVEAESPVSAFEIIPETPMNPEITSTTKDKKH